MATCDRSGVIEKALPQPNLQVGPRCPLALANIFGPRYFFWLPEAQPLIPPGWLRKVCCSRTREMAPARLLPLPSCRRGHGSPPSSGSSCCSTATRTSSLPTSGSCSRTAPPLNRSILCYITEPGRADIESRHSVLKRRGRNTVLDLQVSFPPFFLIQRCSFENLPLLFFLPTGTKWAGRNISCAFGGGGEGGGGFGRLAPSGPDGRSMYIWGGGGRGGGFHCGCKRKGLRPLLLKTLSDASASEEVVTLGQGAQKTSNPSPQPTTTNNTHRKTPSFQPHRRAPEITSNQQRFANLLNSDTRSRPWPRPNAMSHYVIPFQFFLPPGFRAQHHCMNPRVRKIWNSEPKVPVSTQQRLAFFGTWWLCFLSIVQVSRRQSFM